MREFRLTARYEPGAHPVADAFIEHQRVHGTALSLSVTADGLWRVDRLTGPDDALDPVGAAFTDPRTCNECLGEHDDCDATWEYEEVAREPGSLTVYTALEDLTYCHSVPYLARKHLGAGLLFDARRRGDAYEWRVLVPGGRSIGDAFDALAAGVGDGVGLTLEQVGSPSTWRDHVASRGDLPHEHRSALVAAVERGYYETPRAATLAEVSAALGLPESTFRYRLRRAEAWLAEAYLARQSALGPGEATTVPE